MAVNHRSWKAFEKLWWTLLFFVGVSVMVQIQPTDTRVIYYNATTPIDTTTDASFNGTPPAIGVRRLFQAPTVCEPNERVDARGRCRKVI